MANTTINEVIIFEIKRTEDRIDFLLEGLKDDIELKMKRFKQGSDIRINTEQVNEINELTSKLKTLRELK